MANNDERNQQEQARQILYDDAHPHSVSGRPRARGVNSAGGRQPRRAQQAPQQQPPPVRRQQVYQQPAQPQQAQPRQQVYQQQAPRQQAPQQLFEEELYEPQYEPEPEYEPQPRQAGRQAQPQRRGRARSFEAASAAPARARAQVKEKPAKSGKSGVVTWLLVLLVLLLLAVAGYLVFLLFNGGLGSLSLGGGAAKQDLPPGGALLAETADAGDAYVSETIFVGDSNFERLRQYGLVDAGTVAAKVGIGVGGITTDAFIEVTGQSSNLTIAQTMAAIGPKRMLVMMGTNDVSNMSVDEFITAYEASLAELRKSAPDAAIVVAAIPPVAQWKDSEMLNASSVRQFNEALLAMCEEAGYPYLNAYEALAGDDGYLPEAFTDDGYHLTQEALDMILQYYRTHAYNP